MVVVVVVVVGREEEVGEEEAKEEEAEKEEEEEEEEVMVMVKTRVPGGAQGQPSDKAPVLAGRALWPRNIRGTAEPVPRGHCAVGFGTRRSSLVCRSRLQCASSSSATFTGPNHLSLSLYLSSLSLPPPSLSLSLSLLFIISSLLSDCRLEHTHTHVATHLCPSVLVSVLVGQRRIAPIRLENSRPSGRSRCVFLFFFLRSCFVFVFVGFGVSLLP